MKSTPKAINSKMRGKYIKISVLNNVKPQFLPIVQRLDNNPSHNDIIGVKDS